MNLNSVNQSSYPGSTTNSPLKAKAKNGGHYNLTINDVVDDLNKEEQQMDKQIEGLKEMKAQTQKKAKKNSSLGTIALTISTISCFGLAAIFKGSGVPAGLGLLAGIVLPWTFLFLSARSNSQHREAAQKDVQVAEVKNQQQQVQKRKKWWNEKKETIDKLADAAMDKPGKKKKIVEEDTGVIIGGVKVSKRRNK